jgi:hypothetical protein
MSHDTPKVKQLTAADFIPCPCGCGQFLPPPRSPDVEAARDDYMRLAFPNVTKSLDDRRFTPAEVRELLTAAWERGYEANGGNEEWPGQDGYYKQRSADCEQLLQESQRETQIADVQQSVSRPASPSAPHAHPD